ncbi:MAG: hypothetical protein Q9N34_10065 [Aquificota bacterium]|nr:hypothetical protein [Aquificota bacterium]
MKRRVVSRFPEVTEEEVERFKGKREEFVRYLSEKTGRSPEFVDSKLEDAGWLRSGEIPAFLRQIGP